MAKEVTQTIALQRDAYKLAIEGSSESVRLKAMAEFRTLSAWRRVLKERPKRGKTVENAENPQRRPGNRDYIAAAAAQIEEDAKAVIEEVQR